MLEIFHKKSFFKMRVIGYEFPKSTDKYDANWLVIEIEGSDDKYEYWEAKDCCLRTFELVELRNWFVSIKNYEENSSEIHFTENELSFYYSPTGKLDVMLNFNFHPKGASYDYSKDKEYMMHFIINKKNIDDFIEKIDRNIKFFPEKFFS